MNKKHIAIIIPAYNEGPTIQSVTKTVREVVVSAGFMCDIIVIDDGSADNTSELAKKGGASLVIQHLLNAGPGGATATGLRYARKNGYEAAVTMDGDGQHAARDVTKGLRILEDSGMDLLIGSRLIDATGMSRVKRFGNKGLSFITYLLFGVRVTDSQSGLRFFSNRALQGLRWRTNGYEFCSEMLWRAKQKGLKVGEFPIEAIYTDYSKAKGQNNWNGFIIVKSLLKHRLADLFL
jgi:glycosyltransferase involved in cell wall biosynthesis